MAENKKRTLRQQREEDKIPKKQRRLSSARSKVGSPIGKAASRAKNKLPRIELPDNRFGRLIKKLFGPGPRYFIRSWKEIRQVTWPTRKETLRLSLAVFVFAAILTVVVAILDFGLDKLFKELIIQ